MAGMRLCRLARCQRSRRLLTAQAPAGSRSSSTPQKKSLRPGDEDVFVRRRAADEDGTGGTADQPVGAVATDEDVAPAAAVEVVITGAADQHVVARGALEPIVAGTAVQLTGEGERAGELDVVVAF